MTGSRRSVARLVGGSGAPLRIGLLGPFTVLRDGRPVTVSSERLRTLVAVLAMSAGDLVTAETIGDRVWGTDPPESVRRSVQTLVARLRQLLGPGAVATRPGGYQWGGSADGVDVLRFLRLLDAAAAATADRDVERARIAEALALWRGTPFEGVRSDWLVRLAAPQLVERYLTALERRIDLDLAAGRHGDLAAELRDLTARHPLRESLWARLLTALAGTGRPAEALAAYEAVRVRLAAELGVDPGPELQALHAKLLAADAAAAAPAADPAPLQLPPDIRRFTGRGDALDALDRLVAVRTELGGDRPIVIAAVAGTGGIGKTAIAVHWAHRVRDQFPDGQMYLNLHGYGPGRPVEPAAALAALLRDLGVPGEEIPGGVDVRSAMLRSKLAGRRMLILLDNARDAEQVRPLLPGSGCLVLITSRSQLRGLVVREGAHRITLDLMPADEAQAMLTGALRPAGVRYDRAGLARLAELCGGLPLALAIAAEHAVRQPGVELSDLIAQLRDEWTRPDGFAQAASGTSASLRAVFSWSYRALPEDPARMFRLLGLHPGADIGVPAAAAVFGTTPARARRVLDQLADVHLVEQRLGGRYEIHDLLRSYAAELAEHADQTESAAASDRMYAWYLLSAHNAKHAQDRRDTLVRIDPPPAGVEPATFGDGREAAAWFAAESQVLHALIRAAARSGRHRTTFGLVQMAWAELIRRREFEQIGELLELALTASRQLGDPVAEALTENLLGMTATQRVEYDTALGHFERALVLFWRQRHDQGQARILGNMAVVFRNLGRLQDAIDHHERSLVIKRRLGDGHGEAATLNNLATVYAEVGRLRDAVDAATRAVHTYRVDHLVVGEATALDTLGQVRLAAGDRNEAIGCHLRSLRLHREIGDRWGEGIVLTNLGHAYRAAGQPERARQTWLRALAIFDTIGARDSADFSRAKLLELIDTLSPVAAAVTAWRR